MIYKDGSFKDPDGFYFDKYGYDKYGGFYDKQNVYHPPPNSYNKPTIKPKDEFNSDYKTFKHSQYPK